jgi:tetratricopeptide (TPR) repeat protein
MPLSREATIQNDKLASQEVVKILVRSLEKAKKFSAPVLLMVEFPTEYTRRKTGEELEAKLKTAGDELVDIDLRKPVNLLQIIEELKSNQVGSVHGLHAQPEVVRQLNWGRERLTDSNKRIVFWLNFEELKDLAERAPDFWAFRNRHLVLPEYDGKIHLIEPNLYSPNVLELSNLSLEAKQNRAEALEELLRGAKDPKSFRAIDMRHSLGLLYSNLGEYKKALEHLSKVLEVVRELGDTREDNILNSIGNIYIRLGEFRKAIDFYAQALNVSRRTGDQNKEVVHLGNLGIACARLGDIESAMNYYRQAITLSEVIGNLPAKRDGLGNLANLYTYLGQFTAAIDLYEQAMWISRQMGDKRGEGHNLGNLGLAYAGLSDFRKSIGYYQESLAISKEIGNRHSESTALGNLGNAYVSLGDIKKALEYHKQALKLSREIGNVQGESDLLSNLGLDYDELSEYQKAIACLILALNIAISIESRNVHKQWNDIATLRAKHSDFEILLRSLFPDGDKILQKATDQPYVFFRDAPSNTPDEILATLNDFEKQKRIETLLR